MTVLTAKKIFSWLRRFWYIPLAAIAAAVLYVVFRKPNAIDIVKLLADAAAAHKKDVSAIEKAQADKDAARAAATARVKAVEEAVRAEYARDSKEITVQKEKEIKQTIKQHKDDPQALAAAIEKQTGYKVFVL